MWYTSGEKETMAPANKLITKTVAASLPPLYAQENLGDDAIVRVKLFGIWQFNDRTWYLLEYNPENQVAFCIVFTNECPDGELGYTSMAELQELNDNWRSHGLLCPIIERDLHFKPLKLREIREMEAKKRA